MDEEIAAIRAYTKVKSAKSRHENERFWKKPGIEVQFGFDRVMVFDTETTNDLYQNLKFGYFKIYQNNVLDYHRLFYDIKSITSQEYSILKQFSLEHKTPLYTIDEFRKIFLTEVLRLKTLCIGFNLPFDLTRISINAVPRKSKKHDGFSLMLSNQSGYPRINLKHVTNTLSFISWAYAKANKDNFKGHFLDLRTLTYALTNTKHTLESACEAFDTKHKKTKADEHGKITFDYIQYCINDVNATYSLYLNTKKEFETYNLDIPITKAYTPASIGKALLRQMGVKSFDEKNPGFSNEIKGQLMTCYFGGRTECMIRKKPVLSDLLDFLSMYPTVCTLQNLWRFVIAKRIDTHDSTEEIRKLVDTFKLEDIQNKDIWIKFPAIVQIQPNEDVLPLRAKYGKKHEWNIGLPYISYEGKLWYSLADVLASKLYTDKTPKILKAISFIPVGVQRGLKEINIHGIKINPYSQDLFKELIEYRQKLKTKRDELPQTDPTYSYYDRLQEIIKIITNATSYGIFVEITTHNEDKPIPIEVFGLEQFTTNKTKVENPGFMFNPIIAIAITSASRLLLATTEVLLSKCGATHAYCDTDSMVIPSQYTKKIQEFFASLNPYSFHAEIFKLEKSNVWFYGISAKRYCLYELKDGDVIIGDKYSAHGLGHLLNPFYDLDDWHKQIWQDILELHYGKTTMSNLVEKYQNKIALSKLAISTPRIFNSLKFVNKGKDYYNQIKPGNFALVGFSDIENKKTGEKIKPITPYRNPARHVVFEEFVDFHDSDGTKFQGKEFWKEFWNIFCAYLVHKESKFDGNEGKLERKHVRITGVLHIGKESNNLDEAEHLGLDSDSYITYSKQVDLDKKFKELIPRILELKPKDVKKFGISKQTLWNVKTKIETEHLHRISNKIKIRLLELLVY